MQWLTLTKKEAAKKTEEWQSLPPEDFKTVVKTWPLSVNRHLNSEYQDLRKKVFADYEKIKRETENSGPKKDYLSDLRFALRFYDILDDYGFNPRLASEDQIWIYLCVNVFPDIVHGRYPGTKAKTKEGSKVLNVNEDRFWKSKRRIYLKVLWWYVYLSLQFDSNGKKDLCLTYKVLENNTTDEVVQLVERAGSAGYRVEVYRKLMKYYYLNKNKYDNKIFRKVMVLNTAITKVVEPSLVDGGITGYIRGLFEYFERK